MKRTPLKRYAKLNIEGKSETKTLKKEIQRLLREIVIRRDGRCTRCGIAYPTQGVVFQCDHLISRSNSATYADARLCVLLCRQCHAWKSLGNNLRKAEYDAFIKTRISPERVALWARCEADALRPKRTGATDWRLAIIVLEQELATYE